MSESAIRAASFLLIGLGMLLNSYAMLFKSSPGATVFTLLLMIWLWIPYLVCVWIVRMGRALVGVLVSAGMIFALDLADYISVFVNTKHSTAALALFFAPIWNLLVAIPIGLLAGWFIERRMMA